MKPSTPMRHGTLRSEGSAARPTDNTPEPVLAAALKSYTMPITAFLHCPEFLGFSLTGRVYNDRKDRFRSGRLIRTSDIREFIEDGGYWLAITTTESVYVLIAEDGPWTPLTGDNSPWAER